MNMQQRFYNLCFVVAAFTIQAIFPTPVSASGNTREKVASSESQTRCGWFDNPTPQNASLIDNEDVWIVSEQGGYSADGDWPPKFKPNQWVRTNAGSYGYGCACMRVTVNPETSQVVKIFSSYARPLSACRKDKKVKSSEPHNPLRDSK
jgi:hypothetical protein